MNKKYSEGEVLPVNSINNNPSLNLSSLNTSMTEIDQRINEVVTYLNLPDKNIVQKVSERAKVFRNLEDVVNEISSNKESMIYLSKFVYAIADGLFDAALNYLWDATINELRARIRDFDVEYFYDVTVTNTEKRDKLKGNDDLKKIQDADLLIGAKKIELLDDVSYHKLDNIRFMRNQASTAHPTEVNITGLELINWLEVCINEVFNIPYSSLNLETQIAIVS